MEDGFYALYMMAIDWMQVNVAFHLFMDLSCLYKMLPTEIFFFTLEASFIHVVHIRVGLN